VRSAVTVFPGRDALGEVLAGRILAGVARANEEGRRYLLGCPGGRSLRTTYVAMARLAAEQQLDLSALVIVMMDDYLESHGGAYRPVPQHAHYSCRGFAHREIAAPLNAGVAPRPRVPADAVWLPDPADPAAYDDRIVDAGGIDLFLLASGSTDGHVAFNGPGTPRESRTRVVELPDTTRRDNLRTFPDFASLEEVPRFGVTVGLATIAEHSRQAILVAHGAEKRSAVRELLASDGFAPTWPASIVHACRGGELFVDEAALGDLVVSSPADIVYRGWEN
jgi:glucosamine-6-phosphate deaminase